VNFRSECGGMEPAQEWALTSKPASGYNHVTLAAENKIQE